MLRIVAIAQHCDFDTDTDTDTGRVARAGGQICPVKRFYSPGRR